MKIGLVCPYNITLGGGVQEVIFALQRHLEQRGHIAKIITALPRQPIAGEAPHMVYVGNAIDMRWPNHTTAPLSSEINPEFIDQMLDAERFDILHFHEPWVPVLSRQIIARSTSVNVATFHASVPETIVSRTLSLAITPYLRSILDSLHELTAVSDPAAAYVKTMTDRTVRVIPNGIELGAFGPHQTSAKKAPKTILYIGRLERRKGVRYLLYAFSLLAHEHDDVRLLIAGDGPERRMLESLVLSLGIPRVTFLGYISNEQRRRLLASADLFCSPALFGESFGIVLLEAMASGLPAVAGSNPGYESLLQGLGGISLANPRDTPELARRLSLMLHEPKLRSVWLGWARGYVQQFDYVTIVDQYEAAYAHALTTHGPAVSAAV